GGKPGLGLSLGVVSRRVRVRTAAPGARAAARRTLGRAGPGGLATARAGIAAAAVAAAALLPLVLGDYPVHVLVVAWYYVVIASSWNLIAGYTGLFSLAHHVLSAIGGDPPLLGVVRPA